MATEAEQTKQAIRRMRDALGITQQQLAVELGKAVRTVARWETTRPPRGVMLAQLERFARARGQDSVASVLRETLNREMQYRPTEQTSEEEAWSRALCHILENRDVPEVAKLWEQIYPKIWRAVNVVARKGPDTEGAGAAGLTLADWVAKYEEREAKK